MMKTYRLAALAAVLLVGAVTPAKAIPVTFSTSGAFDSSGGAFNQNGVVIRFVGVPLNGNPYDVPPESNVSFGYFVVDSAPAAFESVTDAFTLTINQVQPGLGSTTIAATLSGTIRVSNSQAFLTFDTSTKSIVSGGFTTTYRVVEGDATNPGRLELFPPAGTGEAERRSNLNGAINSNAVIANTPEPGTMALAGIALPLLGLGYLRRRRNA